MILSCASPSTLETIEELTHGPGSMQPCTCCTIFNQQEYKVNKKNEWK